MAPTGSPAWADDLPLLPRHAFPTSPVADDPPVALYVVGLLCIAVLSLLALWVLWRAINWFTGPYPRAMAVEERIRGWFSIRRLRRRRAERAAVRTASTKLDSERQRRFAIQESPIGKPAPAFCIPWKRSKNAPPYELEAHTVIELATRLNSVELEGRAVKDQKRTPSPPPAPEPAPLCPLPQMKRASVETCSSEFLERAPDTAPIELPRIVVQDCS